jgi:hypothetical protein
VAFHKYRPGRWCSLAVTGFRLLRMGGRAEARTILNAVGVKLPLVRRWMVT